MKRQQDTQQMQQFRTTASLTDGNDKFAAFRELGSKYSLIRLNEKRPIEKEWQSYCHKKRCVGEVGFQPGENAGIACGPASGLMVLDVDDEELFGKACRENGWTVPETRTIRTGRGRPHYYFQYPEDGQSYRNRSRKDLGFDIRGDGGQVVAPGSIHPDTGIPYAVERDLPEAPAPEWVLNLALAKPPADRAAAGEAEPEEVQLDSLPISSATKTMILEGKPQGERSEAIMRVLNALVGAGLKEGQILWIFEEYPIGEKYREKGGGRWEWLVPQIERAMDYTGHVFEDQKSRESIRETIKAEPGFSSPINGITHQELTDPAFDRLMENLKQYGNNPSSRQQEALYEVLSSYTRMAQGELTGRYAFPLATGLGKTQSIVAWLAMLYETKGEHVSVAVCASKVEALCDLKRDLIAQGVPEERIGLLHSYQYNEEHAEKHLLGKVDLPPGYATLPCTSGNDDKQILLVTHNRVKGNTGTQMFNLFRGTPRDLLIWDESLLISDTRAILDVELKSGIGYFRPRAKESDTVMKRALDYLDECIGRFERELKSQGEGMDAQVVKLPELTPQQVRDYKKALGDSPVACPLKELLEISQEQLRIVNTQQNDGVITYDIVVPTELENIIILDASHPIRELVKLDKSIQHTGRFSDNIVAYENVTVHQLRHASGRHSMTKEFQQRRSEDRTVCREITEVVSAIPADEGCIIFAFKPRKGHVDFRKILNSDLQAAGIDTEAKVKVTTWRDGQWVEEDRDRFAWLTWGNETSLSKFSYCRNVIFAGVLHRSDVDIASAIAGQSDNLLAKISGTQIKDMIRSEIAHCLYQGMARGACRIVDGVTPTGMAKTKPMKVWLIHKDQSIKELIRTVMPGVNWEDWQPVYLESKGKIDTVISALAAYLAGLSSEITRVSSHKIKQWLLQQSLPEVSPRTFTNAIRQFTEDGPSEWKVDGRSLVRAGHYFFPGSTVTQS